MTFIYACLKRFEIISYLIFVFRSENHPEVVAVETEDSGEVTEVHVEEIEAPEETGGVQGTTNKTVTRGATGETTTMTSQRGPVPLNMKETSEVGSNQRMKTNDKQRSQLAITIAQKRTMAMIKAQITRAVIIPGLGGHEVVEEVAVEAEVKGEITLTIAARILMKMQLYHIRVNGLTVTQTVGIVSMTG